MGNPGRLLRRHIQGTICQLLKRKQMPSMTGYAALWTLRSSLIGEGVSQKPATFMQISVAKISIVTR